MNCRSTRNWDWLFFSPEYVAQFPECTDVSITVKKLSLLLYIAKFLEYEIQQGYRADREI